MDLIKLILDADKDNTTEDTLNALDINGFSPLLSYSESFISVLNSNDFENKIKKCLKYKIWKSKKQLNENSLKELNLNNLEVESCSYELEPEYSNYQFETRYNSF